MAEDEQSQDDSTFRAVAGYVMGAAKDRPDLLLVEIKTLQGPMRLSLTKGVALKLAASIAQEGAKLAPDRSAH
jgi:hypothetical protein